jgi:hypothetical protein
MTEKHADPAQDNLLNRARDAFDAGGVDAVVTALKSINGPTQAGCAFDELSRNLYNAHKDVTNMIAVAEAGIAFCLDHGKHAESAESARKIKEVARILAFNAGANSWPGWGDEGVDIAPSHIRSGLKLASLSRDLVRELHLGPKQEGVGAWLIGALKLAAGEPVAALAEFQEAARLADSRGDSVGALSATGYCALARKADPATASVGTQELELAVARLRELDSKEANSFAEQLITADKILLGK